MKHNIKSIRLSDEELKKANELLNYINETLSLELNFSDMIHMIIKSEYNRRIKNQENNKE